jgi:hypothetical protein
LIREAAYDALLKSKRKELHRVVARTIDEAFPALKEAHPEVLAHHWTKANVLEPAILEWRRAGDAAKARNAFEEGLSSYRQALALIELLPASPQRYTRELEFRTSIVQMLQITRGWSSKQAAEASEQAAALAEKSGNLEQFAYWLGLRAFAALISSDLSVSLNLADQCHRLQLRLGKPTGLAYSYTLEVMARHWIGDLIGANEYFETGLTFFDDPVFRLDPVGASVAAFAHGSLTVWILGRPDAARERLGRGIAATNAKNVYAVALAGHLEAALWILMREFQCAESVAVRTLELSDKHQFQDAAARACCLLGAARTQLGHIREGAALIAKGLNVLDEMKSPLAVSHFMALLAEAEGLEGKLAEALATAERAVKMNREQLARRPEVHRIRGELYLKLAKPDLAEDDFHESIAIARQMQAKAWELRSTMSLGAAARIQRPPR